MYYVRADELIHHGILGQKWGKMNGPPYPLSYNKHSAAQKRLNTKSSLSAYTGSDGKQSLKKYKTQHASKKSSAHKTAYRTYKKAKTTGEAGSQHNENLKAIERSNVTNQTKRKKIRIEEEVYQQKLKDIETSKRNKEIAKKVLIGVGATAAVAAVGYGFYKAKTKPTKILPLDPGQKEALRKTDFSAITDPRQQTALKNMGTPHYKWLHGLEKSGQIGNAKLMMVDDMKANTYATQNLWSKGQWDALTASDRHGIKAYTAQYYRPMNMLLRGTFDSELKYYNPYNKKEIETLVKQCKSGMDKLSLPKDALVHRGIGSVDSLAKTLHIDPSVLKDPQKAVQLIGKKYTDDGFGSFGNAVTDAWDKQTKIHALIPKGAKAMYVDPISAHQGEHELLTQAGSNYIIKDVLMNASGVVTDIFVEMLV